MNRLARGIDAATSAARDIVHVGTFLARIPVLCGCCCLLYSSYPQQFDQSISHSKGRNLVSSAIRSVSRGRDGHTRQRTQRKQDMSSNRRDVRDVLPAAFPFRPFYHQHSSTMSGRGRGVSNKPAWMTSGEDANGGVGAGNRGTAAAPPPVGLPPPSLGRDQPIPRGGPPPSSRGPPPPRGGLRGGGGRDRDRTGGRGPVGVIRFRSWEHERDWVEDRRRRRRERRSKFDVEPTPEQMERERMREAALAATAASTGGAAMIGPSGGGGGFNVAVQPQQTRHARRLYIGNIPDGVADDQLRRFFHDAIARALGHPGANAIDDPILNVYINEERRFAFIEFKTMEMTSACMAFDDINVLGRGKVKVKRPNDYNPALAPDMNPNALPKFDLSKLGIVSSTVPDGPDKIFIGGLHYHLTDDQVLELLSAFGQVKAFNLVKTDPAATTNKGYAFVQYADSSVTPIAIMGLNGMDLGGGKTISAKGAASRGAPGVLPPLGSAPGIAMQQPAAAAAASLPPPGTAAVVDGVDVNALLEAAMGGVGALPPAMPPPQLAVPQPPPPAAAFNVHQIADAALNVAFGPGSGAAAPVPQQSAYPSQIPTAPIAGPGARTRILVLLNMVTDEDLASDEELSALMDEVQEECAKFGRLVSMKIPRLQDGVNPSAVKKIFLEYASVEDVARAEAELVGRQFGPNVVQATYFPEDAYAAGQLY